MVLILSSALVLEQLAKSGRPRLASLHFAGVGIGIAVSAALVATQRAFGTAWGSMWVASGALSLLGAVAVALLLPGRAASASAPGQRPPLKRRRPAPGAYGPDYTGPRPSGVPEEPAVD